MPDGLPETLGEVARRVNTLERQLEAVRDLVDGQQPWSIRKRLHNLEDEKHAAVLVSQALDELRAMRQSRSHQAREWGSFVIAVAALVVAIFLQFHGIHH